MWTSAERLTIYLNVLLTENETAAFEAEFPEQTKENKLEFYCRLRHC